VTGVILSEKEAGDFSVASFYDRRIRRILPALFVVVTTTLPVAWILLPPTDLEQFWRSLVALSAFSSNILFWQESGYFDSAAELKPLLHRWSLAVEEQYYLLFPLSLLMLWRLGQRRLIVLLSLVAASSLALAEWGTLHKPLAAYFLLPTRGWELLLGSLVAFHFHRRDSDWGHPI
jgi:peptidoglycan/LPS O-acetylase OafA/YrhL